MERPASESASAAWTVPARTALRIMGAVFGGYAFSAAWVALVSVALTVVCGIVRSEAVILASMLGFPVYLGVLIWGFSEPALGRVWTALSAGAALSYALMCVLKASIPSG